MGKEEENNIKDLLDELGGEDPEHEEEVEEDPEHEHEEEGEEDPEYEAEEGEEDPEDDDKASKKVSHEKLLENEKAIETLDKNIQDATKEEAKLEVKLEQIEKSSTPNMSEFNKNIEKYITPEAYEARLEDDASVFIDAVEKARKKYIEDHTDTKEIDTLKNDLAKVKKQKEQYQVIKEVTKEYPDFDFNQAIDFYKKKLTGEEQEEIAKMGSTKEGLIALYKRMSNPPIKRVIAPKKPRLDEVKKRPAKGASIALKQQNFEYLKSIGLGE